MIAYLNKDYICLRTFMFLFFLSSSVSAEAPGTTIARVRVPSSKVNAFFPPGTDVTSLPRDEFEKLARRAGEGDARRRRAAEGPRLARARHIAFWRDGVLFGRSEFVVDRREGQSAFLPIEPWSPAVAIKDGETPKLSATADGRFALRLEANGPATIAVDWTLRGRVGSDGRAFAIDLPKTEVSSLSLDLPANMTVEGPLGVRQGPSPGATADRKVWRFDGPGGATSLRVIDQNEDIVKKRLGSGWVGGTTFIDVDEKSVRSRRNGASSRHEDVCERSRRCWTRVLTCST